ncbi:odorant receptor 7a-like [Cylas formicarius]|uniref:odorant receptor 7a-like n=1 Tax=Cylas formicarius TaxID=197179 RepID=UPI002958B2CF|nr:odorant receptor 7a-like [Cylas formicarius]
MKMNRQTVIKELKAKPILNYTRYSLIMAGIWPLRLATQNRLLQRMYSIYSGLIKVYFPSFLLSLSVQFILSTIDENTDENPENIFSQLNYIIGLLIVGVAAVIYQDKNVKEILNYITQDDKEVVCSKDKDIVLCHLKQARVSSRSCLLIMILTFWSGVSMCLENFYRRLEIDHYNKHYNESVEKPFPYVLYYYNLDPEKHATSVLVANNIFVVLNCLLFASTKMLFFSCIIYSTSILKRLQIKFVKLDLCGKSVSQVLRDLVQQHQNVIEFVAKLNKWIKYLVLLEFLLNSLNIATVSIQFITFEKNMLASPILFFCVLFTQTFVLGWTANEIKCQSLVLADILYCCPWYDQSEKIKSTLLIMILRAQKPLVLTIGPLDAMTIQSALAILKASYSYVGVMMNNYK